MGKLRLWLINFDDTQILIIIVFIVIFAGLALFAAFKLFRNPHKRSRKRRRS